MPCKECQKVIHELKQRVGIAIARIHHQALYFEGMDELCQIVGYASLNHYQTELDKKRCSQKFNNWVKESRGFKENIEDDPAPKRRRGRPRKVA